MNSNETRKTKKKPKPKNSKSTRANDDRNAPKMTTLLTFKIDQTKREEQDIKKLVRPPTKKGDDRRVPFIISLHGTNFEWTSEKTKTHRDGIQRGWSATGNG